MTINALGLTSTNENIIKDIKVNDLKFYLLSLFFSIGNIALPLLCHQYHLSGNKFLPIYFFVLIAGYQYGWQIGLSTAILSPSFSYLLTGMPIAPILLAVIIKGSLLGIIASIISKNFFQPTIIKIGVIIVTYQVFGVIFDFLFRKNFNLLSSDLIVGFPGLLIQLFGGYLIIKLLQKIYG